MIGDSAEFSRGHVTVLLAPYSQYVITGYNISRENKDGVILIFKY